jgi:transcriptional regulator with XRE-family HTH domain
MNDTAFLSHMGRKIKHRRHQKKLCKETFARKISIVKFMESGKIDLDILTIRRIAKALDVEISFFFER